MACSATLKRLRWRAEINLICCSQIIHSAESRQVVGNRLDADLRMSNAASYKPWHAVDSNVVQCYSIERGFSYNVVYSMDPNISAHWLWINHNLLCCALVPNKLNQSNLPHCFIATPSTPTYISDNQQHHWQQVMAWMSRHIYCHSLHPWI